MRGTPTELASLERAVAAAAPRLGEHGPAIADAVAHAATLLRTRFERGEAIATLTLVRDRLGGLSSAQLDLQ